MESLGAEKAASDPHRQKFHIQPMVGWLNDPNGLCKIGDTYHAFFQYGPFDVNGGVKHWGISPAVTCSTGTTSPRCFTPMSRSTATAFTPARPSSRTARCTCTTPATSSYPGAFDYIKQGRGHNVCLAVSRDGLHIDSKQCLMYNKDYPAGLTCHVRDPKVFACEGRYYMVLGARTVEDRGEVLVLESEDKYTWRHTNTLTTPEPFGFMWECPDLFQLDGQWFLAVSPKASSARTSTAADTSRSTATGAGDCILGDFYHADFGFDYYAPRALPMRRAAAFKSAGWVCPTPPMATPPPWPTAGSTA